MSLDTSSCRTKVRNLSVGDRRFGRITFKKREIVCERPKGLVYTLRQPKALKDASEPFGGQNHRGKGVKMWKRRKVHDRYHDRNEQRKSWFTISEGADIDLKR